MDSDKKLEELAEKAVNQFLDDQPIFATYMGKHEKDDTLGDFSPAGIARDIKSIKQALKELDEIDSSGHSDIGRINRELFRSGLELQLFQLEEIRSHESDADFAGAIGSALFPLFSRDFASFEERMRCIAARLEEVPQAFEDFKKVITKPINLWTKTAIQSAAGTPGFIQLILSVAEGKLDSEQYDRLQKAATGAIKTLEESKEWLEELAKDTANDWAIGPEKFEKLLQHRKLGLSSDKILELGYHYLDLFKEQLREIAEKISPGSSVKEVEAQLKTDYPKTFDDVLETYREWVGKAKDWVIVNDFVTVREGKLSVVETPQFLAPILPTAALVTPGLFEKEKIGEYIVTRPPNEELLNHHYNARIPNTCIHEAYPGHFNEALGSFEAPLSRFFHMAPEMVEGWAFYCEQATKDMGFDDSPKSRFGQIQALIYRAARIVVDVKLSRGEMSFDEAVKFMIEQTGANEPSAIAEVTRYTQTPGYPLSYLLGRHQIMEARKTLEQEYGEEFDLKLFHDTIVTSGRVPISYIPQLYRYATSK